jgi:hypothetical protein
MSLIDKLFPKQANNNYQGSVIALYVFYLLMAMYTFRSFMHFLAQDGGINSIASIIIFPFAEGAADPNNVIYLFASLWGSAQLLTLFIFYICMSAATMHPLSAPYYEHLPPGATSNLPLLAIACIMLLLSLRTSKA